MEFMFPVFRENENVTLRVTIPDADPLDVFLSHFKMGIPHRSFNPNSIFDCVNRFLKLHPNTYDALFDFYEEIEAGLDDACEVLKTKTVEERDDLVVKWADTVGQHELQMLMIGTRLLADLEDFCATDDAVVRTLEHTEPDHLMSQRRDILKFYRSDYTHITMLAILSRILMPVWGMMHNEFDKLNVSVDAIEEACYTTVIGMLLGGDMVFTIRKIQNMIDHRMNLKFHSLDAADRQRTTCDELIADMGMTRSDIKRLTMYDIMARALPTYIPEVTPLIPDPDVVTRIRGSVDKLLSRRMKEYRRADNLYGN